jgi:hypothetical protein
MANLRDKQVNPLPFVIALVVVVLGVVYFAFIKPAADDARIAKQWSSAEEAAKRGPGRQYSEPYKAKLQDLLQKEGRRGATSRRERE